MNVNAENVKDVIDSLDLGGMTGRDAMRHIGRETIMAILSVRGAAKLLSEKLGFANSGAISVATADLGWREAGTRDDGGMGTTKPRAVKIKGSLPSKTSAAIAIVIGLNPAEDDIGWTEYLRAVDMQGADWIDHLYHRLGGRNSDGGKDFTAWIDSNRAADAARAEAEARSNPRIKARNKSVEQLGKLLKVFEEGLWDDEFKIIQNAILSIKDLSE